MLDIQFIREHPEVVKESQRKRGESVELVDEVLRADEERRSSLKQFEEARARQKEIGKQVAKAAPDEKAKLIAQKNPRTLKRFIRCENYDDCGTGYPLPQYGALTATEEVCEHCGAPMVIVTTARGPWKLCPNFDCPGKEQKEDEKGAKGAKGTAAKKPAAKAPAKKPAAKKAPAKRAPAAKKD